MIETAMKSYITKLPSNLRWGVTWGLLMSGMYCLVALLLYIIRGPTLFAKYGLTLGTLMLTYVVGGITGGWIVGVLRPLTHWRFGAILVGISVGFVVYGAAGIAMYGPVTHWDWSAWLVALLPG